MKNGNRWRLGIIITLATVCTGGVLSYGQIKEKTIRNERDIEKHDKDIRTNTLINERQTVLLDAIEKRM